MPDPLNIACPGSIGSAESICFNTPMVLALVSAVAEIALVVAKETGFKIGNALKNDWAAGAIEFPGIQAWTLPNHLPRPGSPEILFV
ncbi:hypothetical protein M5C99_04255 [Acidovorax sp. NCPPB 2350]|nr:hypothetical protein M5C99_04255 [Acidovorax sp. NCPPB 2350]